jgi:hypothetical protein
MYVPTSLSASFRVYAFLCIKELVACKPSRQTTHFRSSFAPGRQERRTSSSVIASVLSSWVRPPTRALSSWFEEPAPATALMVVPAAQAVAWRVPPAVSISVTEGRPKNGTGHFNITDHHSSLLLL